MQANATASAALALEGACVAWVGKLADVTPQQLQEAVESAGGRIVPPGAGDAIDILVLGGGALPLTPAGDPDLPVRPAEARIVSESDFLQQLAIATDGEAAVQLFSLEALAEILREPPAKVRAWYKAGLIQPSVVRHGVPRFEFRQVSAARTLAALTAAGVSPAKLRRSLQKLRQWLPDIRRPLEQLDVLEHSGELLVRLEAGELAEADGQLQMPYEAPAEPPAPVQLRLVPGPSGAGDWHEQGVDQERFGLLDEAEASYRRALLDGGPDAQVCFDLAHALQSQGKLLQALERYRQTLELDPRRADAWNNLGVVLSELGREDEACTAFRSALRIDSQWAMAHYNLADTLEAMGLFEPAKEHWRAYLKLDSGPGPWAMHARQRLAGR